jgi:hypothetical protein
MKAVVDKGKESAPHGVTLAASRGMFDPVFTVSHRSLRLTAPQPDFRFEENSHV